VVDLLTEVPKPLHRLRERLVQTYKFCEDERQRLNDSKPQRGWNMFEPTEAEIEAVRQIEDEDSRLGAQMQAYLEVMRMIQQELDNLVREHMTMEIIK
jgi:hypothetical protein